MKPLYILVGVVFAVIIIMALTGCATPSGSQTAPIPAGTEESPYTLDYVELPDGQTLTCLWYNRTYQSGSMSCNWEAINQ